MTPKIYRFGTYRLLPLARELWREDIQVALPSRAFDCLVYLIEHRERAVGRDELISAVWGRTDISDTIVAQTILRIRRTLGDDETVSDWIRTVPRFGYRWVADLREEAQTTIPSPRTDPPASMRIPSAVVPQRRLPSALTELAIIATGLTVLAALAFLIRPPPSVSLSPQVAASAVDAPAPSSWMVLPVSVEGPGAPDWIRLGVMDAIAERLRRSGLAVLPSVQTLVLANEYAPAGQPADIGSLFAASGERRIVQPQMRTGEEAWHMTLTVQSRDQALATFRGVGADALAAAQAATTALLTAQGLSDIATEPTPRNELLAKVEAAMLAGRLGEAETWLAERSDAFADDPILLLKLAHIRYRQGKWAEALELSQSILARNDIEAGLRGQALIRAGAAHLRKGEPTRAEQSFREALAVLPDRLRETQAEAWNGLGIAEQAQGRLDDATRSLARARALLAETDDQLGYARVLINLGLLSMESGQPLEALEYYLQAEPIVVRFGAADEQSGLHQSIAWSRLFLGQLRQADESARRGTELALRTENPLVKRQAQGLAARIAIRVGDLARAGELIDLLARHPPNLRYGLNMYRALLAEAREDFQQATSFARTSLDTDDLDREGRGESARILLAAAIAKNDVAALARPIAEFATLAQHDESDRWRYWHELAQACALMVKGEKDRAGSALAQAWRDARRLRQTPNEQIEAGLALGGFLLRDGQFAETRAIVDQLATWLNEDYRIAALDARLAMVSGDAGKTRVALDRVRQLARERPLPADLH